MPEVPLRALDGLDVIERRVADLWAELARDGKTVMRACKMNLVVATRADDALPELLEDLGRITDMEPGRVIVLSDRASGGEGGLTPWIAAHCHLGPGGHPVCSEQIVLETTGEARALLPEALRRVLVSDMPVFVWWRAPLTDQPLLRPIVDTADRLIVNSGDASLGNDVLPILVSMTHSRTWHGNVGDLAWERTEPWREIVASMFDEPRAGAELSRLRSVEIACRGAGEACGTPGLYLAGWLVSRLGWTVEGPARARRPDGGSVAIVLASGAASVHGRITHVRLVAESGAVFHAGRTRCDGPCVRVLGQAGVPRLRHVEPMDDLTLLHGELQRDGRDPVYETALRAAAALSAGPAGP
ncbi:MAG TPA: glucose-6-phosphate dehydrogenase assembly protein OpcA [Candidatus Polarisedimenticolaceae bacterium]|nr:glucose-6-phosphate dehydrogenase assembly protein OpcA [Candidatus Polarisedimenticolaceae bacterium]